MLKNNLFSLFILTYKWSHDANETSSSISVSPTVTTTYTVTVTDMEANDCEKVDDVTITELVVHKIDKLVKLLKLVVTLYCLIDTLCSAII